ncbi:MAG: hypothetical protein LKG25_08460 [Prevotella sp.]|jgi:type IV secretory pathway VirB10-like protein|nr:hypothetical protein [Prevotella sp.]MCI1282607.1 hypothetical protein [Prevotella sp.]
MTTDKDIQTLLDRYMEGLTTLEEEAQLADYFKRNSEVKEEWKPYQKMFKVIGNMGKETAQEPQKQPESHKAKYYILSALAVAAVLLLLFSLWPKGTKSISNDNLQQPIMAKVGTDTASTVKADTLQQLPKQPSATQKKHLYRREMPQPPKIYMAQATEETKQESTLNDADAKLQQLEARQALIDKAIDIYLAKKDQMMASITENNESENTY